LKNAGQKTEFGDYPDQGIGIIGNIQDWFPLCSDYSKLHSTCFRQKLYLCEW